MKNIILLIFAFFLVQCGGGPLPEDLKTLETTINKIYPQKEILLKRDSLGLVERIFYYPDLDVFAAVGHKETCSFNRDGQINNCGSHLAKINLPLKFLKTETGAYFDLRDPTQKKWLTINKKGLSLKGSTGNIIGFFKPPTDFWYQPAISSSEPHIILISTDKALFVRNNKLRHIKKIQTPGIKSPLHVVDGAFVTGVGKEEYFVSLFTGRGGWPRSILFIHNMNGEILYHEILDRFMSVMPIYQNNGLFGFMLGGHGKIALYKL